MMLRIAVAAFLAAVGLVAVSATAQTIEAELILEAFDGCGCTPLSAPLCPAAHDLKWRFHGDWWTVRLNTTGPIVASETPARRTTISSLSTVQVTFSESVTGVTADLLEVNGRAATTVSGSGAGPYTFSGHRAPGDGVVFVELSAGSISGASGAFGGAYWTYMKNKSHWITVASASPAMDSSVSSLSSVQVTFSEAVTGVLPSHCQVGGSAATVVTGSGAGPYEFTGFATPADGVVRIELASGTVIDAEAGTGCNVHDGSTYDPSQGCPNFTGLPYPYPNPSFWGDNGKVDQDWYFGGFPLNFLGNNQIKNGSEFDYPANQGSQGVQLLEGQRTLNNSAEFGCLGYIDPDYPQDKGPFGSGRIHVDRIMTEFNANFSDIPLPTPIPGLPVHLEFDVRRDQDNDLVIVLDAYTGTAPGETGEIQPSGVTFTLNPVEAERTVIRNDPGTWHTYRVGTFSSFPDSFRFLIIMWLRNPTHPNGYPWTAPGDVQCYIDNVRLVYPAEPFPENCSNDFDDDGDTKVDCDDEDCYFTESCPCNPHVIFDIDNDTDVDQFDFAFLQTCLTGPGDPGQIFGSLSAACKCLDVAGTSGVPDFALDQQDLLAFEACASGPGVEAALDCDD